MHMHICIHIYAILNVSDAWKKKNCRLTEKLCLSGGNSGTCKLQLPRTGLTKLNSISKPKSVQPKRPTRRMRNTNNRNLVSMPGSFFFALLCTAGAVYVMCVCVLFTLLWRKFADLNWEFVICHCRCNCFCNVLPIALVAARDAGKCVWVQR